ncbi:unnamed protein product [Arctia plantaginis]|uniref:Regulatory protein zeste n=1 Tax=Arctia plantaginis TaxID=874455 RepID=A0A8S0Z8T4_ARCPL|nr:unnamed protein product [Arctia plantaginis]CAB3228431.1 unnamed protein product [Arctia plantaginis]
MRDKRGTQAQFEIMLDFMERNGDISKPPPGSQGRLDNLQKWLELADLLNKSRGEPKPLEKWRKAWSDLKNNTKRKIKKIKGQGGDGPDLTDVERRLLKLLREQSGLKRSSESDDDNEILFKEEMEPDPCTRTLSPPPQYFCAVNGTASRRRKSTASSFASDSSSSNHTSDKRKKPFNDEIKEVTDRYFEFEREREKLAHEREMARIKQNEQLIGIFGRMVNVLESLTPSVQKYLNRNNNEGG